MQHNLTVDFSNNAELLLSDESCSGKSHSDARHSSGEHSNEDPYNGSKSNGSKSNVSKSNGSHPIPFREIVCFQMIFAVYFYEDEEHTLGYKYESPEGESYKDEKHKSKNHRAHKHQDKRTNRAMFAERALEMQENFSELTNEQSSLQQFVMQVLDKGDIYDAIINSHATKTVALHTKCLLHLGMHKIAAAYQNLESTKIALIISETLSLAKLFCDTQQVSFIHALLDKAKEQLKS